MASEPVNDLVNRAARRLDRLRLRYDALQGALPGATGTLAGYLATRERRTVHALRGWVRQSGSTGRIWVRIGSVFPHHPLTLPGAACEAADLLACARATDSAVLNLIERLETYVAGDDARTVFAGLRAIVSMRGRELTHACQADPYLPVGATEPPQAVDASP